MKILTLIALLFVMGCGGDDRHGYGSHTILNEGSFGSYKEFESIAYSVSLSDDSPPLEGGEYSISFQSAQGLGHHGDGVRVLGIVGSRYCLQFTDPLNNIDIKLEPSSGDAHLLLKVSMISTSGPPEGCPLVQVYQEPPVTVADEARIDSAVVFNDVLSGVLLFTVEIETSGFTDPIDASRVKVFLYSSQDSRISLAEPQVLSIHGNSLVNLRGIPGNWVNELDLGDYYLGVEVHSDTQSAYWHSLWGIISN